MKFIWEESDVLVGRKYSRPDISEVWMIGYRAELGHDDARLVSVSLSDGMVTMALTREEMVDMLNQNSYIPAEFIK